MINKYRIGTLDINKVYKVALKERLILIRKIDNLSHRNDIEGTILLDKLYNYILDYNIYIGKRKVDFIDNRSGKRY